MKKEGSEKEKGRPETKVKRETKYQKNKEHLIKMHNYWKIPLSFAWLPKIKNL